MRLRGFLRADNGRPQGARQIGNHVAHAGRNQDHRRRKRGEIAQQCQEETHVMELTRHDRRRSDASDLSHPVPAGTWTH